MGSQFHHGSRFLGPPFSSRTVGFPESGWRPGYLSASETSPPCRSLSAGSHTPLAPRVHSTARQRVCQWICGLNVPLRGKSHAVHPVPRAPLPSRGVTSQGMATWATSKGITPSSSLLRAHASVPNPPRGFASARPRGPCRLLPAPAERGTFPTLSLRVFPWMLGPVSRRLAGVLIPVTSPHNIGLPRPGLGSACRNYPAKRFLGRPVNSGRQSFLYVQASKSACHPDRSHRCVSAPQGSHGVYIRAERMSLPSCASDMLVVRIG